MLCCMSAQGKTPGDAFFGAVTKDFAEARAGCVDAVRAGFTQLTTKGEFKVTTSRSYTDTFYPLSEN